MNQIPFSKYVKQVYNYKISSTESPNLKYKFARRLSIPSDLSSEISDLKSVRSSNRRLSIPNNLSAEIPKTKSTRSGTKRKISNSDSQGGDKKLKMPNAELS